MSEIPSSDKRESLTPAIIERMRAAGKAGYLDTGNPAWDMLCDLALAAVSSSIRPPTEMAVCEINRLVLHRDQPYIFRKHAGCKLCEEYDITAPPKVSAAEPSARVEPLICYMPCKAHEGMSWTMTLNSGYHQPAITKCPICEPPK